MTKRMIPCLSLAAILCFTGAGLGVALSHLADAAQKGDRAALGKLLEQNGNVNAPQVDGSTALHWAVYRNDPEMADMLIRAGADANVATREGVRPLYMASLYGNAVMIEKLLKAGADATQRGPSGETVLMVAARNGNSEAVKLLIASGADVNASEPIRGTTALMWAVARKNAAAAALLLDAGADAGARSLPARVSPIPRVSPAVNVAVVRSAQQRLLAGLDDRPQDAGQAAVPQPTAAAADDADTEGPGPGDQGGMLTALIFAAREGDLESAKLLLAAGADVNQVTNFGWTPLLTATHNRNYQLAKFFIDHGADVNVANRGGWTPLYLAADNRNIEAGDYPWPKPDMDHLEFIRILLDRGADTNARNRSHTLNRTVFTDQWFQENGATPFVRAAQSGDVELMRLLLAYGADPMIATAYGDTALAAASGIGWVEGVTYESARENTLEAIRLLLELGLDPNASNRDGRTPLMGAALKGRNEVVQVLVDAGARLETRDYGSRDTDKPGSLLAGHTWQAIDYSEGLVRVGVQSAPVHPETAAFIRQLMTARGLPVPDPNRTLDSICIVVLCKGDLLPERN